MAKHPLNDAPTLFVDTLRQFSSLVQGEMKLARAEMSNIITRAGVGILLIALSMLTALVALNVFATAAVAYVAATGLSIGLAALIVGGVLIAVALILALSGKSRLSADALSPDRTTDSLREDLVAIKEASNV